MEIKKVIELVVKHSIDKASQVLSKILRAGAKIELENIDVVDITRATEKIMREEEKEILGSMISIEGDISCKFLFLIKVDDALIFTDLMLRNEPGTTAILNDYTKSAIQEIGNILSGAIANTFSKDFNIDIWPSTPVVLNDFLGVIFSNFIVEGAESEDVIWLIQAKFLVVRTQIECEMFLIPHAESFALLQKLISEEKK